MRAGPLKQLLARYAPGFLIAWAWQMQKRCFPHRWHRRERHLYRRIGDPRSVVSGPFRGMRYIRIAYGTSTLDKTLGIYEREIHAAVESMIEYRPDVLANAGTAEGYYLVGMASRLPGLHAVGYDRMAIARHLARRLARLNGVADRVELRGLCSAHDLERVLSPAARPALISDIDGAELDCLRPDVAPSLQRTLILVELHDMFVAGVSAQIRARFHPTHDIEVFPVRTHRAEDVPAPYGLTPDEAMDCVGTQRPYENFWWLMRPRSVVRLPAEQPPEIVVSASARTPAAA
jgi:hypothetical protein